MYRRGLVELVDGDLGHAEVTNLARLDQFDHRGDCVGDLRVDPVQVVQVDRLDAEALQRCIAVAAHSLGTAVQVHTILVADDAELGRHRDVLAAAGQCPAEQRLVVAPPVADRRVEHPHAKIDRAPDQPDRFGVVGGSVALGQSHAAQPDSRGRQ